MTFRELVYMVRDEIKAITDDSIFTDEHIIWLLSKYRAYILAQQYRNQKKAVPESNYQTLCLCLEDDPVLNLDICGTQNARRSTETIPDLILVGYKKVYPQIGFQYGNITYVSTSRFKYVGNNQFNRNVIYATIGPDKRLYLKSDNDGFMNLQKVRFTGVFENPEKAALIECENPYSDCVDKCDVMDHVFPIEEPFANALVNLVTKELLGAMWMPKDDTNNSNDDTSDFGRALRDFTNNRFKKLMGGNNNGDNND